MKGGEIEGIALIADRRRRADEIWALNEIGLQEDGGGQFDGNR
jgi:hypothetical protein